MAITGQQREQWYRAMGQTARDSLPQIDVLKRLEVDFGKTRHALYPVVRVLLARLNGATSSRHMAPAQRTVGTELQGLVPDAEATLIQAGVQSGRIAEGFENAAEHVAQQSRLKSAVAGGLAIPALYLLGLNGLFLFFSLSVMPAFDKLSKRSAWPDMARALGWVTDHILWLSGGSTFLIVGFAALVSWLAPRWTGPHREWADRHLFPFGLIAQINGSVFMSSLAGYISAGVPIVDAVKNIAATSSAYMGYQCALVLAQYRDGNRRFEECLQALTIIDRRYHWLLNVYALSTDVAAAYRTVAAQLSERTLAFIKNLFQRVIGFSLLALIGASLLWIYLSMFAIADVGTKKRAALGSGVVVAAVVSPQTEG